ncbi:MAG: nitroreductase family protein [Armatimonadota bacterium]|nr:nitroreductase family protein [Armatimonadota bacterium]
MIEDIIKASRSYRRFHEDKPISEDTLRYLVNLARLSPSAANLQPLKYIISADRNLNERIFPTLAWAGYLRPWMGPAEGERPVAYIIILGDTEITKNFGCDHGIAAQSIMLGAAEKGIGGCMIGAIDRQRLREVLGLPERYEILLVIALGYPSEKVVLEDVGPDGSIKYYRDSHDVHHVPKRPLEEIILKVGGV